MFDVTKKFTINIPTGDETKTCRLRFPTDAEWIERSRSLQTIRRSVGRGKAVMEIPNSDAVDARLFAKIRVDDNGVEFDEAEAAYAVRLLDSLTVTEAEMVPEGFRVVLTAYGMEMVHVLGRPMQRDILEYSRNVVKVVDARRQQEIKISLVPARELYDKLCKSTEGYQPGMEIPIVHKDAVISEINALLGEGDITMDPE